MAHTTPSQGKKGEVDKPLAGETPEHQTTPAGSRIPLQQAPLW